MINGYIHVMSCNLTCTDYYKLGPEILGWCKTLMIIMPRGMDTGYGMESRLHR